MHRNMIVLAEIGNEELFITDPEPQVLFSNHWIAWLMRTLHLYAEQTGVSFDNHSLYVFSNNNLHPSRRTILCPALLMD